MKNFKVITEKTSRSRKAKARDFFQALDDGEKSRGYCIVFSVVGVLVLILLILTILYAAVFE